MSEDTIWKPCLGWENYEASSSGEIRSLPRVIEYCDGRMRPFPGRVLKPWSTRGYLSVQICNGTSVRRKTYVHTLVCEAFHGPRPHPDHEVRHLNGNRLDNRPENLRWGTGSENKQDAIRHGTQVNARKTACPRGHKYDIFHPGQRRCSICDKAKAKEHRQKFREQNREQAREYGRAYYQRHREKIKARKRDEYHAKKRRDAA